MGKLKFFIVVMVLLLIAGILGATDVQYKEKVSLGWPITKSLIVGFGSGSAAIGDQRGAMIGAWTDGIGLTSALIGAFGIGVDWFAVSFGKGIIGDSSPYGITTPLGKVSACMIIGGGAVIAVSRAFQMLRTAIVGVSYNKKATEHIALDVAFIPTLGRSRIALTARISL